MILGRTPNGAIKIKTDNGLRAVNCACCVSCGDCIITVNSATRIILDTATTGTLNGYAPVTFFQTGTGFAAEWDYYGVEGGSAYYQFFYSYGCFYGEGWEGGLELISTVCCDKGPPGYACSDKDLTINGVVYSIHNFYPTGAPDPGPVVPPPVFIFS